MSNFSLKTSGISAYVGYYSGSVYVDKSLGRNGLLGEYEDADRKRSKKHLNLLRLLCQIELFSGPIKIFGNGGLTT